MVVVVGLSAALRADDERLKAAATVLTDMAANPDLGISPAFLAKAKCIVIVPSVKKAALGVGGEYGRGYFNCRRTGGWSAPGAIRIEGGSIGAQIGGTGIDIIMLVMNDTGATKLLSSKFTLGADAAIAAGPVGRDASAQTDLTLNAEILAWSRARGLFAGISLRGSTLREDGSENKALYGHTVANTEIVKGTIAPPAAAAPLMAALAKY
jgi:lipid-binding SYLF domain-containing protein